MLPKELASKYEIRGTLGSGAMGTVYDALDRVIERRVAVKVVRRPPAGDPEAEESHARFRREAQASGRLSHPNIVAVYDYGESDEFAWIVMELVEGGSLKGRIDQQERFTIPEIAGIMDQVLAALAYSHSRGVVHRDIKPANIMLTADRTVKMADFGIARLENSSMTQVGTVMGTPSYMAPEQLRGETVDARADIWAAGVMLYQLLTGEKPFEGGFSAVMHKALHTEPPPPSQLSVTAPRGFDAVVAKAMAKRPEDRFPTAAAFAEAIRAAAAGGAEPAPFAGAGPLPGLDSDSTIVAGVSASPVARPAEPAGPAKRKAPVAGLVGGGAVVLAAAAAAWFFLAEAPAPPEVPPAAPPGPVAGRSDPPPPATEARPPAGQPAQPVIQGGQPTPVAPPPSPAEATRQQPAPSPVDPPPPAETAVAPERQAQAEAERQAQAAAERDRLARAEAERARQAQADAERQRQTQSEQRLAQYRAAAAAAATAEACSLINWQASEAGVSLVGVIRRGGDAAVRQTLQARGVPADAISLQLQPFDGPYCPALDVVRPFAARQDGPLRAEVLGVQPLAKGDLLRLNVSLPAHPSQLYVGYLMKSGDVAHLVASRPEPAGAEVRLGDPRPGFPGWEIDEPFGTDLILVFASDRPIFPQRRPVVEKLEAYLEALTRQLADVRSQGGSVSVRPIVVETVRHR